MACGGGPAGFCSGRILSGLRTRHHAWLRRALGRHARIGGRRSGRASCRCRLLRPTDCHGSGGEAHRQENCQIRFAFASHLPIHP